MRTPVLSEKIVLFLGFLTLLIVQESQAQVFKKQDEALMHAFPDSATIERRVLFLTDEQTNAIQEMAKTKLESKIVTYYEGSRQDSVLGYVFFGTETVRTKPATFMTVLQADGSINYVEILAFYEPMDYLPIPKWFTQFIGKSMDQALWPRRGIHNVSGATLSVRAITFGVRKVLATYEIAIRKES